MSTKWLLFTLSVLGGVAPAACSPQLLAPVSTSGEEVMLTGYPEIRGETVLLFETEMALRKSDLESCRNVGADLDVFRALAALQGKRISIEATDLGTSYADRFLSGEVAIHKLRNRRVEPWCDDRRIYWASEVEEH